MHCLMMHWTMDKTNIHWCMTYDTIHNTLTFCLLKHSNSLDSLDAFCKCFRLPSKTNLILFDDLQRWFNEYDMIEPSISDQIHFKIIQHNELGIQSLISDAERQTCKTKIPELRNVWMVDGYETFIVYNIKGFSWSLRIAPFPHYTSF